MLVFSQAPEEFTKMQSRILTRFTIIPVFLFTCLLTMDVVAKERDLAPLLSPDAWQLISRASAYRQGFTPAKVTPFELEPRRVSPKSTLIKRPNSRVKVKFADDLKIRLGAQDKPYSSTGRSSGTIEALVDSLGVTLKPVHSDPVSTIDALVEKIENFSGKQQPDLAGIYWIQGEATSIDAAAEMLYASSEVEWVMYSPLLIRPTESIPTRLDIFKATAQTNNTPIIPTVIGQRPMAFGACRYARNDCDNNISADDCEQLGGVFLGPNSVCAIPQPVNNNRSIGNGEFCSTVVSPEVQEHIQRMVDDGTWDERRSLDLSSDRNGPPTRFVMVSVHSIAMDAAPGNAHVPQANVTAAIAQLNLNVAATGLVFCQAGAMDLINCTPLVISVASGDTDAARQINPVPHTMNVWFMPSNTMGFAESSFPGFGLQGIVIDSLFVDPTDPGSGGNYSIFTHEVGHYFNLLHTHSSLFGVECVDRINCGFAGDLFCDTAADPITSLDGLVSPVCVYTGTALDPCGSGQPYTPSINNFMSYSHPNCLNILTTEQLSMFLSTALTDRLDHLSVTACGAIPASGPPSECELDPATALPPGPQNAICCLIDSVSGFGPGCLDTDQATCNLLNGIMMEATPFPFLPICLGTHNCGPNPPLFADYDLCGECDDFSSYFTGDCYIDQSTYLQTNRRANTNGCLDAPFNLNNYGNFIVPTNAPVGQDAGCQLAGNCCIDISESFPWCELTTALTGWDAACASYAIDDAFFTGFSCGRSGQFVNPCAASFGPTQGNARQPFIDVDLVGANIDVTILSNPSNMTFEMELLDIYGVRTLNLYFTNTVGMETIVSQNISGGTTFVISQTASWIEYTADSFGMTVDANCCASAGCCYGQQPPDVTDRCEEMWTEVCGSSSSFLGTFARQTIEVNVEAHLYASIITSATPSILIGACSSPVGLPSTTRVAPDPTTGSPDFAAMGLMMWMSQDQIPYMPQDLTGNPWGNGQLYALPNSTAALTSQEIRQLHQLVPWPMGGADSLSGTDAIRVGTPLPGIPTGVSQFPPVASPDGTINWTAQGHELFPDPANPSGFGGMEVYNGAYGYGQQWEDDGIGTNGAFGNGIKIAVLDWSAHLQERQNDEGLDLGGIHAELSHVKLEGRDTPHSAVGLIFDENLTGNLYPFSADHGTGMLGIIGAQWGPNSAPGVDLETRLENNIGVLGMVPDAELYFFPLASVADPLDQTDHTGGRMDDAWAHAIETLDPGDIICAGYRPVVVGPAQPNLNYWDDSNMYLGLANDAGICTVIQAGYGPAGGSGGIDLGSIAPPDGEKGAIVATAVSPGRPWKRMADGSASSNYTTVQDDYSTVTVSGWGMAVTTCGKGPNRDNYLGFNTCLYNDATNAHDVHEYAYTNNFGGTSAAAAIATGSVAILQGFSRQIFEIPLGTNITRQLIAGGRYEGIDKNGEPVMPWVLPTTEMNSSDCQTLGEPADTWDVCDEPVNMTGSLSDPRKAMVNAIYNPIFATPNIDEIIVIRGDYMEGNKNSISSIDSSYFSIFPTWVNAHALYPVPNGVPFGNVSYRGNGLTTDLYVTGALAGGVPFSNKLDLSVTLAPTTPQRMFLRPFLWDFYNNRWRQPTASAILPQGSIEAEFEIDNAAHYIDPTTDEYHLRIVTLGNNSNGGPTAAFPVFYDQIRFSPAPYIVPLP